MLERFVPVVNYRNSSRRAHVPGSAPGRTAAHGTVSFAYLMCIVGILMRFA